MKRRIDYIDGLKGLSAILVSLYHFMILGNFNGYVGYGTNYTNKEAIERILNYPLSSFITNNSVGLYIFFVLIAIFPIMSYRRKNSDGKVMGRYACKRYFQLLPMCLIMSVVMVIIYDCGFIHYDDISALTNHPWISTCNPNHTNILLAIKTLLFDSWLTNTQEITSLWCLYIVFKGSMYVYASYALFGQSKYKYLPALVLFVVSLADNNMLMFAFGSILGEIMSSEKTKSYSPILCVLLIIFSVCFMKMPMPLYPFEINQAVPCSIGAFLIILSIMKCEFLQHLFSNKVLTFLSKISFEIVVCHPFMMGTIAYPLTVWLIGKMEFGFAFGLVIGVICTVLTIPFAYAVSRWITPLGGKLAKKVESICFEEN